MLIIYLKMLFDSNAIIHKYTFTELENKQTFRLDVEDYL